MCSYFKFTRPTHGSLVAIFLRIRKKTAGESRDCNRHFHPTVEKKQHFFEILTLPHIDGLACRWTSLQMKSTQRTVESCINFQQITKIYIKQFFKGKIYSLGNKISLFSSANSRSTKRNGDMCSLPSRPPTTEWRRLGKLGPTGLPPTGYNRPIRLDYTDGV